MYSADHAYNPEFIDKLYADGYMTPERHKFLRYPDFDTPDLILHECGIPPIVRCLQRKLLASAF